MINWFNMPAEGLSNGGQFEIKELTATENKTYEKDGEVYNKVTVNVPSPTGKITITENGTDIDVAQYATADVSVEGGGGDNIAQQITITLLCDGGENYKSTYRIYSDDSTKALVFSGLDSESSFIIDDSLEKVVNNGSTKTAIAIKLNGGSIKVYEDDSTDSADKYQAVGGSVVNEGTYENPIFFVSVASNCTITTSGKFVNPK